MAQIEVKKAAIILVLAEGCVGGRGDVDHRLEQKNYEKFCLCSNSSGHCSRNLCTFVPTVEMGLHTNRR
jgi:hypothetical protein